MAITIGNNSSVGSFVTTSITVRTLSHDNDGSTDNVVVGGVIQRTDVQTITAVTYGGQTMTLAKTQSSPDSVSKIDIFYLVDAPTGVNTFSVTVDTAKQERNLSLGMTTLNGVDQTSVIGATAGAGANSATSLSTSITGATTSLNIDLYGALIGVNNFTAQNGQTINYSKTVGSEGGFISGRLVGTGSAQTMGYSDDGAANRRVILAVEFLSPAVAGNPVAFFM